VLGKWRDALKRCRDILRLNVIPVIILVSFDYLMIQISHMQAHRTSVAIPFF
jgi:hypothetical protein